MAKAKPAAKKKKPKETPKAKTPAKAAEPPTASEIRKARKAQLVEWCLAFGLDPEGKVDELRDRLHEYVERPVEKAEGEAEEVAKPAPEEEVPPAAPPAVEAAPVKAAPKEEAEEPEEEPEEALHVARRKPTLDERVRRLLGLRAALASRRPAFRRQEWFRYKRLGDTWRKPQGGQSKLRRHMGYRWNIPSIGYRSPRAVRGLHASGFREVLVHNLRDLEGVDPSREAVRVAHGVGTRKRELIEKACDEREIRILNRMVEQ